MSKRLNLPLCFQIKRNRILSTLYSVDQGTFLFEIYTLKGVTQDVQSNYQNLL